MVRVMKLHLSFTIALLAIYQEEQINMSICGA